MKKYFSNWRKLRLFQLTWWTKDYCTRLILVISTILIFPYLISILDFQPATLEDYAPLYEQAEFVRQNPSNDTHLNNVNILIDSTQKSIIAKSDECTLILHIDKISNEVMSISEVDNAQPLWLLLMLLMASCYPGALFATLFACIMIFIRECKSKNISSSKKKFSRT